MITIRFAHVILVLVFLQLTASLPLRGCDLREDNEEENFQSHIRPLEDIQSPAEDFPTALLEAFIRNMLDAGLRRKRQLGDLEFSSRYTDFLRSKAKHRSMCTLLQRMQAVKNSAVGADVEKVNQLLKLYMCPSVSLTDH